MLPLPSTLTLQMYGLYRVAESFYQLITIAYTSQTTNEQYAVLLILDVYIYIVYTPNIGLIITAFVRGREQGCFNGSSEGAGGSIKGARGALREQGGALRKHWG